MSNLPFSSDNEENEALPKALVLYLKGDYPEALSLAEASLLEELPKDEKALALSICGSVHLKEYSLDDAEMELKEALETDPSFGNNFLLTCSVWNDLSRVYEEKEEYNRAIECMNKGLAQMKGLFGDEMIAQAYYYIADYHDRRKAEDPESIEMVVHYLDETFKRAPMHIDALLLAGTFYGDRESGQYYNLRQAMQYFQQFMDISDGLADENVMEQRNNIQAWINAVKPQLER